MTTSEALIVKAAQDVLRSIQHESSKRAYSEPEGHNHARVECAADAAADMIGNFIVYCHVYGDDDTKKAAAAVLDGAAS
jgi:hypothetical protein